MVYFTTASLSGSKLFKLQLYVAKHLIFCFKFVIDLLLVLYFLVNLLDKWLGLINYPLICFEEITSLLEISLQMVDFFVF